MNIDPNGTSLTAIIVFAIFGVVIGLVTAGVVDYNDDGELFNGSVKWYNYLGAALLGGLIGAAVGYAYPYISSAISSALSSAGAGSTLALASGGTTSTALSKALIAALIGLGILFAKIPMHGLPNSKVSNGNSIGEYDENGNLISRQDIKGKAHYIKKYNDYFLPHTHKYEWEVIKGVWRIVKEFILPF